jgi:hypothetical protein
MVEYNRQYAKDHFYVSRVAEMLEDVYNQALQLKCGDECKWF